MYIVTDRFHRKWLLFIKVCPISWILIIVNEHFLLWRQVTAVSFLSIYHQWYTAVCFRCFCFFCVLFVLLFWGFFWTFKVKCLENCRILPTNNWTLLTPSILVLWRTIFEQLSQFGYFWISPRVSLLLFFFLHFIRKYLLTDPLLPCFFFFAG